MEPVHEEARKRAERYLAECKEYTHDWEREKLIGDWTTKRAEAENVVGDFKRRAGEIAGKRLLDIGCGNGTFMAAFARAGASVSGLEVNPTLVDIAKETLREDGASGEPVLYDGTTFPFPDNSFDHAFSVSVLEHVSDPKQVLHEAARVLKPGGTFYLAFPNKWHPLETHTGVLFLSFLPRDIARFLLRTFWRRNSIDELNLHFLSFWTLKRLLRGISLHVLPEYGAKTGFRGFVKRTLGSLDIHFSAILGTVMVILEKRS
ncbi:hypothetical protein A3C21_02835 [Candidatus Kaiserbacteria bacterium RIFCSPHIGHO2_02_FULL_59_21]|uniref:Methyltransferase type 11 domain-containing protein n=1 Tax=Candidatus Kaiserbacteria bacterium RIFCSPHIGHO2_02_FULL_59_21 TaxID=1798500 RepID=A0A1F6DYT0_9BACT|nr:MAG: hypothetical protein A2766_04350 [Candidatus Kaiserbacteria bacterium RIFCSPHIGHO2_01_FULL_58_22]OGG66585.1 MAG: hypothetical protein A3C21_02835 [Candidatus Kaiserbacteria bacterium RIFCSPHIGHO2_02_FULL_59_21]OGG86422.1 MAG: hypothetical protein A3I47_01690 [Candidatus Kaiserbacteria bacterium RIFCSPLOWO2_02_FULL_59_19]